MIKRMTIASFVVSIFLLFYSSSVLADYYSMTLHYNNGAISTVANGLKIVSGNVNPLNKPYVALNNRIYECNVLDVRGVVLYSLFIEIPRAIHGDWVDETGETTGAVVPLDDTNFFVRVPYVEGAATIKIISKEAENPSQPPIEELSIDISAFPSAARVNQISLASEALTGVWVFVAEGYTDSEEQRQKFTDDVENAKNYLLNISPFDELIIYVEPLFVASTDSGADHPSEGIYVDTAFDATYDTYGHARLLTVNDDKVKYKADEAVADPNNLITGYDYLFVIVNDEQYGGSGGNVAVFSTSIEFNSTEIAAHEAGHVIGKLADEYETPYPGYPEGDWEPNVTYDLNVDNVSNEYGWWGLIDRDWPGVWPDDLWDCEESWTHGLPCPTPKYITNKYGLFEGARYFSEGIYRPKHTCKMRSLNQLFCEVCKEALRQNSIINQRPTLPVITFDPDVVLSGETVNVCGDSDDPEGGPITYKWEVYNSSGPYSTDEGKCIDVDVDVADIYTFYCTAVDDWGMQSVTRIAFLRVDCPALINDVNRDRPYLKPRIVKITGENFGVDQGRVRLQQNGSGWDGSVLFWSDTEVRARIPLSLSLCNGVGIIIEAAAPAVQCYSNAYNFTVPICIGDDSDLQGSPQQQITIRGEGFGTDPDNVRVEFCNQDGECVDGEIVSVTDTEIVVIVPDGLYSGHINVYIDNGDTIERAVRRFTVTDGIAVTSPQAGDTWTIGSTMPIEWASSGVTGNVIIKLGRPSGCGGYSWSDVISSTSNVGIYDWTVEGPAKDNCIIRITSVDPPAISDESELFDIVNATITTTTTTPITTTTTTTPITTTTTINPTYTISGSVTNANNGTGIALVKVTFSDGRDTFTDSCQVSILFPTPVSVLFPTFSGLIWLTRPVIIV